MRWPFRRAACVSPRWLRNLDRSLQRVEYHGVWKAIWPIDKSANEHGKFNRHLLRAEVEQRKRSALGSETAC